MREKTTVFRLCQKPGSGGKVSEMSLIGMTLTLVLLLNGCGKPTYTYPILTGITEIVITDRSKTVKKITDERKLLEIGEFINKQRGGWNSPITSFPITKIRLNLYCKESFCGGFGVDERGFSIQRDGRYDSKPASEDEVQSILNLIEMDKDRLKWN